MKLGLIVISAVIGLFLGTGYALASAHAAVNHSEPRIVVPQDKPVVVELPEVIEVAPITVYGTVPRKHAHVAPKQWVCGDMHDNSVGGRNRDCEWR